MASSMDKGKETVAAAVDLSSRSSPKKENNNNNNRGEATGGDEGKKTTAKTVRMSQPQIDLLMSFDPPPLEPVRSVSKEEEDRFTKIDMQLLKWEKEIGTEKEMVRTQYEQRGYVEYEADANLFPRHGRRRARHGIVVKKKPQ